MRYLDPCELCFAKDRTDIKRVPGDGPWGASVLLCGEGPGRMENSIGRPFCGPTGAELDTTYMPRAGLSRNDCYVTNSFRCKYADSGDTPDMKVVMSCAEKHLRYEIERVQPDFVVLMGGIANKAAGITMDLDAIHGTGRVGTVLGHKCKIFSTLHPARGLHMGKDMQALLDDFTTLRGFLSGEIGPLVDAYPHPSYYRLITPDEVDSILSGWETETWLAADTESSKTWKGYASTIRYTPWCVTFAVSPGEAYMIRVVDKEAMLRFLYYLLRFRKSVFHNLPYDARTIENISWTLGAKWFKFPWSRCEDTMAQVYHDGRFTSKGLKAVSYQLLGAEMRNFEDVVLPYGRKIAAEYFKEAMKIQWPEPVQESTGEMVIKKCPECAGKTYISVGRGKLKKIYDCEVCGSSGIVESEKMTRKQGLNQKIKRLMTDLDKNPELDVWERWENWDTQVQPLIDRLGPVPLASVDQVPEDEILEYAGSDAHSTLRIYPILRDRLVALRRLHCG